MIELEEAISLREAARLVPRRRAGKSLSIGTLYRWAGAGLRGHKLETIRVGDSVCTSRAALAAFFAALSREGKRSMPARVATPERRKRAKRRAARACDAAGIV